MNYTFGHAKTQLCAYVRGGMRSDADETATDINEAIRVLMEMGNWKHTVKKLNIYTYNNCVAMPRNVDHVIAVDFDSCPALVHGQWFEFTEAGPGELSSGNNLAYKDLHDEGMHPTFFPITDVNDAQYLIAFSTAAADATKSFRVRGLNSMFEDIAPTVPGEILPIHHWSGSVEGTIQNIAQYAYSSEQFVEITSIQKEQTTGYVTLYAYDPDNSYLWMLGKYHPYDTDPHFRRYRITATNTEVGDSVSMLVKIKHVDLVHDSDPLPIQSLEALRWMLIALNKQRNEDLESGLRHQAMAVETLDNQLKNAPVANVPIDVQGPFSFGDIPDLV